VDTTVADPLIGRLIDGRYQVEAQLARGGMATVYRAVDTRLDRPVALKVMHPGLAEDHAFVTRFIREARSAARLSHPGIVAVYDQGDDAGTVFLAMEYVPGRTLRDLLRERGRLTPRAAFDILEPVLSALAAAHHAGLVHRDVKPENVLLADDGRVKVADFGLARSALASGSSGTTQGVLMGTVAYLAPEQVERGVADQRTDVYSAGIMLFEMLTGAPPFSGETPLAIAYQHVNADVPGPSTVVPGLADDLDLVVEAACDRDPDGRPGDAAALLRMVQGVRDRMSPAQLEFGARQIDLTETLVVPIVRGPATPAPGPVVARYAPAEAKIGGPSEPPRAALQHHRARNLLLIVLALLVLAGAVAFGTYYIAKAAKVPVPSVVGQQADAAGRTLTTAGFALGTPVAAHSETVKPGFVISSDPAQGTEAGKGSTVVLTVSNGPERFAVPNLVGQKATDVAGLLAAQHLAPGTSTQAYSETVQTGYVISTDPVAGSPLKRGTAVRFVVSSGVPPSTVPKLTGLTLDQAKNAATDAKVAVRQTGTAYDKKVALGSVISQSIAAGTSVPRSTQIGVVVSLGPPLVEVPDEVGKDVDAATKALQAKGFRVQVNNILGGLFGLVRTQDPQHGKQPFGSTITLGVI
jgi:serine/threonine-protein kinase